MIHLSLNLALNFGEGTLQAEATEVLKEKAKTFLLNKGLKVNKASTRFSQGVKELRGLETFEVNTIELEQPTDETKFVYSGKLESYESVFPYLKDSISKEYTLLRTDSLFYPIPAEPNFESLIKSVVSSKFNAEITIEGIPDELMIAFGGDIHGKKLRIEETTRLDIAIAPFEVVEEDPFRFFLLSKKGIERTVNLIMRAYEFYSSLLGRKGFTYTVIETPENYGGQAGKGYMLVSGSSLRSEIPANIYHELAHFWNPKATPEAHLSRFFDEAFANYLTALAVREIHGEDEYKRFMANLEWWYKDILKKNPEAKNLKVPEWGRKGLHLLSYTKGVFILKELHDLIGDSFYHLLARCIEKSPIDFKRFRELAEEVSGKNLRGFFEKYF
ncbi:hypothetical protein PNA2_1097 [Pyrococcus sp. NA2]|uniref:peptidase n=1 Tax=Pyrococcus sp. (strain NA2) TaxID=342949 RepID=UPI000209AAEB|nr:peptidase [Pyrococcus sp. NA2]AEC52013.1 hypothetical protein PNA2_1097 [Pyrococcus sp. NA2]